MARRLRLQRVPTIRRIRVMPVSFRMADQLNTAAAHAIPRSRHSDHNLNFRPSRRTDALRAFVIVYRVFALRQYNYNIEERGRARRESEINAMSDLASSVFRSRWCSIAYWVTTALVVFELALGGRDEIDSAAPQFC